MRGKNAKAPAKKRLIVGLMCATAVASFVPSIVLGGTVGDTPESIELSSADETTGDEMTVVADEGGAQATAEANVTPHADDASGKGENLPSIEGQPDLFLDDQHYIKRGWDGEKVTEETATDDALILPANGVLGDGVYAACGYTAFKERMVIKGDAKLILMDGCELNANGGIHVQQGATLSIFACGDEGGKLVVNADHGAGIGAYSGHKGGDVVVHGGAIEVHGGKNCAGIGSNDGDGKDVGCFTMYGGTVTSTGGSKGAGIGGGKESQARVKIYGGEVHAEGGEDGAGIGGGEDGCGGSIEIYGGEVHAKGSTNASGIGGGENRDAGTVAISGGKVFAVHRDGAGIGGGEDGDGGTINISGGEVHSDVDEGSQGNGAGIGGGNRGGKGGTITISGGDVTVKAKHGAGIGGGRGKNNTRKGNGEASHNSGDGGTIKLTGGKIDAESAEGYGIGAGNCCKDLWDADHIGSGGNITIDGAQVVARGYNAGIGGDGGTLAIKSGDVYVGGPEQETDGSVECTGIGIDFLSKKAKIEISGGVTTACGETGILLRKHGMVVTGGTLRAIGAHGSGIGGNYDAVGALEISGQDTSVYAEGGYSGTKYATGISGEDVTINISDGAMLEAVSLGNEKVPAIEAKHLTRYDTAKCGVIDETGACTWIDWVDVDGVRLKKDSKHLMICACEHGDGAYDYDKETHTLYCRHCRGRRGPEAHDFDEHGDCAVCGRKADHYTVTFDPDNGEPCITTEVPVGQKPEKLEQDLNAPKVGCLFDGWRLVGEDGSVSEESYGFDEELDRNITLKAKWVQVHPCIDHIWTLEDGRVGLRFYVTLPEVSGADWSKSYMVFRIEGKGNQTITVPFADAVALNEHGQLFDALGHRGDSYAFDCPLSVIQMGDRVTGTFHYGFDVPVSGQMSMARYLPIVIKSPSYFGEEEAAYARALMDYGHYAQVQLAKEHGWTFDKDSGHQRVEAATDITTRDLNRAVEGTKRGIEISVDKRDTVSAVTADVTLGSTATISVSFTTTEDVKEVTIDGKPAPEGAVTKIGDTVRVSIAGIRGQEMADAHEVRLTTSGSDNTTAVVSNLSPVAYARCVLTSRKFANDEDVRNEMVALYNYYCAAKNLTEKE